MIIVITALLFLVIGYIMGRSTNEPELIQQQTVKVLKRAKQLLPQEPSGPVMRPTVEQIMEREDPVLGGTNEAMRQQLKDLGL